MEILLKPLTSGNYFKGRFDNQKNPIEPDMVCIHVGVGTMNQIYNTFNNRNEPSGQKSSHYIISRKGEVWYIVDEADNAFAQSFVKAPRSRLVQKRLATHPSPNSYIISIENEGYGNEDFTSLQYDANATLLADIHKRRPAILLDREHIIRHDEIRTDKVCPGIVDVDHIVEVAREITEAALPVDQCKIIIAEKENLIKLLLAFISGKLKTLGSMMMP